MFVKFDGEKVGVVMDTSTGEIIDSAESNPCYEIGSRVLIPIEDL